MVARSRRLSANLLKPTADSSPPQSAGAGGAWRVGLKTDALNELDLERAKRIDAIMSGAQAIELDPNQIEDRVGSDRRDDWRDQEDFLALRDSIDKYGQDNPIEVWPIDVDWRPESDAASAFENVRFELVTGRRRRAVAEELGRSVRAVILPPRQNTNDHHWQVLLRRYRENNHRANLTPLEKMTSVGEMYGVWRKSQQQGSIRQFAGLIGVDPSFVSRSVRLFEQLDLLRQEFSNPYRLSYRELEAWLLKRNQDTPKKTKPAKAKGQGDQLKIGGQKILIEKRRRSLVLTIPNAKNDAHSPAVQAALERLVLELTKQSDKS